MTTQQMIDYTNVRLNKWYANAKLDYNITGSATCRVEGDLFIVDYTENGVSASWSMGFYEEHLGNGKDYFFNVWSEEAIRPQPKGSAPVDTYQGLDLDQTAAVKHSDLHLDTTVFKVVGGLIKIEAVCERTNKPYNVWFQPEDIAFSLDVDLDVLEGLYSDVEVTDSICTAANDIYARYLTGTTTYDIVFQEQKVKGYKFKSQLNKEHTVCASRFADIIEVEAFREKNNYKSYSTVLG